MDSIVAHLGEKLLVPLLTPEETDDKHAGAVDGEQGPDAVELAAEDFQHNQRKRELRQSCANVGPLERPLGCAHFNNLVRSQGHRSSPVLAEMVPVSSTTLI